MKRTDRFPETSTFHYFDANPADRITTDCVIRAVCMFTRKTWAETYRDLTEVGIENSIDGQDVKGVELYLAKYGWQKMKQPRKADGSKYTAREFCQQIAKAGSVYVLSLANHLTYVSETRQIWDIWDCGGKCVGNYWVRKL